MTRLVVIDGSLRPAVGNTAQALARCTAAFGPDVGVDRIALAEYGGTIAEMATRLRAADGFLVGTGTYWGSWGSPLQQFLELMTPYEATEVFLGKPASVVVTMDSTGGSEVAARLASTFVCFGCSTPPFGWMTLSRIGVALGEHGSEAVRDVWTAPDLIVLAQNLVLAARLPRPGFRAWTVDRGAPSDAPWPVSHTVPSAAPDFL
ncbi:MAG TPA: NAD(P)H-dependent oxidoreductase [Polyangiaceae bacterium]|jgi:chromate reductase|nr:NAD(P)H-dependent oxidoreductase [Polyangiaceae bacterium]